MRPGIARVKGKGGFVLDKSFLIFAELHEAESKRIVGLNEIGIDLQSVLQMLGRGTQITRPKGLFGALKLFNGFGGNMKLADRDCITGIWRSVCWTRLTPRVLDTERSAGIKQGGSTVGYFGRGNGAAPGLRVKI